MTKDQINEQLHDTMTRQLACGHQTEALTKLFEAAALIGNKDLMNKYREELHNLLDIKLDNCNSIMILTKKLVQTL